MGNEWYPVTTWFWNYWWWVLLSMGYWCMLSATRWLYIFQHDLVPEIGTIDTKIQGIIIICLYTIANYLWINNLKSCWVFKHRLKNYIFCNFLVFICSSFFGSFWNKWRIWASELLEQKQWVGRNYKEWFWCRKVIFMCTHILAIFWHIKVLPLLPFVPTKQPVVPLHFDIIVALKFRCFCKTYGCKQHVKSWCPWPLKTSD